MNAELLALLILLACMAAVFLACVVATAMAIRTVNRRNRVSPSVRSDAPVTWMGAPHAGARLHRRLRTAVRVSRRSADAAPAAAHLSDLATELEREAVTLDAHLVMASHLTGSQGRARMRALADQVRRIEQLASQISLLSAQAQAPLVAGGHESALDDLARKLTLLEEARHEIAQVEMAAGVERVSPYADPAHVPAEPVPAAAPTLLPARLAKRSRGRAVPGT